MITRREVIGIAAGAVVLPLAAWPAAQPVSDEDLEYRYWRSQWLILEAHDES